MVNINLLPWREYEQAYQMRVLKQMLALAIVFVLLIMIVIHMLLSQQEFTMHARITALNEKLSQFRIQQSRFIKPVQTVLDNNNRQLSSQSSHPGKLFSEIGKMNQAMVCFTGIERLNKIFSFTGKARSMTDLTEFLRDWNAAYLFTEIQIKLIEQQDDGLVRFGFQAKALTEPREV